MSDQYAIEGGHVLAPDFTVREANVLVDREAGEVIEVGPDVTADETLDATNALVMPGLVNAHTHVAMTLLRGHADDKPLDAWLQEDIWPVEAELTPEDIRIGTELGLVEFIKNGITGFADSYFEVGEIAAATEQSGFVPTSVMHLLRLARTTMHRALTPKRAWRSPASSTVQPMVGSPRR